MAPAGSGPVGEDDRRKLQQVVESKPESFQKTIRCGDARGRGLSSDVFESFLTASAKRQRGTLEMLRKRRQGAEGGGRDAAVGTRDGEPDDVGRSPSFRFGTPARGAPGKKRAIGCTAIFWEEIYAILLSASGKQHLHPSVRKEKYQ